MASKTRAPPKVTRPLCNADRPVIGQLGMFPHSLPEGSADILLRALHFHDSECCEACCQNHEERICDDVAPPALPSTIIDPVLLPQQDARCVRHTRGQPHWCRAKFMQVLASLGGSLRVCSTVRNDLERREGDAAGNGAIPIPGECQ